MAEKLTPQQSQAVSNRGGRLLVSAAAGSGKTKVLVDRLLSYILDPVDPANIDDFLIITYTKAAAAELRGKIADKISERIAQNPENRHLQRQMQRLYLAKISTVHAYCADILRENAHLLDISGNFRVAEEDESIELQMKAVEGTLDEAYKSIADDLSFRAFIETLGIGRNDARVPELIYSVYGRAMCHLDPEKWLQSCLNRYLTADVSDASETAWGKYLLDGIKKYLQLQIEALSRCAQEAHRVVGFEKPAALLDATVDQLILLKNCETWDHFVSHMDIDYGTLSFPRKCPDAELADKIKAIRNACKKGLEKRLRRFTAPSMQLIDELLDSKPVIEGMINLVRSFAKRYATLKRNRNILDFADLEHKTLDLFLGTGRYGPTSIAHEIGQRFREVMIDEYQDSNSVQDAIYSALTAKRQNCFMVGDVKQSIYQFRLADPMIFLEKYHSFLNANVAEPGQGRKVLLSHNFRSSAGVIDAVNDVFTLCMSPNVGGLYYSEEEKLHEGIPHIPLDEPEVELYGIDVQEDTYLEEAAFTAERIDMMLSTGTQVRDGDTLRPVRPGDIVILLRSPGSVGGEFQNALEKRGIRCSTGRQSDLLQTEEIQVLTAILQIISNPLQDIPLISAMTSRVFCFTADDLARIRSGQHWGNLYSALKKCEDNKSCEFLRTLNSLRRDARISTLPKLLEHVFLLTKIDSIFAAMPDGDVRTENLQLYYQLVCNFAANGQGSLDAFLNRIDVMKQRGFFSQDDTTSEDAVRIMSIHKSKGLEFPVVFLSGLSKDFNQEDIRGQILCDRMLGIGINNTDSNSRVRYPTIAKNAIASKMIADGVSEELRVLYVAMTRARDRLIMTYASRKMHEHLDDLSMRLTFTKPELMAMDTMCAGDWVLMTALVSRVDKTHKNLYPWNIRVVNSAVDDSQTSVEVLSDTKKTSLPLSRISDSLKFIYPNSAATTAPSKQTATQIKGRIKDQEAFEHTKAQGALHKKWRTPSFAGTDVSSTEMGQIVHTVMQRICFRNCSNLSGVEAEVKRLADEGFISHHMLQYVDCRSILDFFSTDIGRALRESDNILREFKFSLLVDGSTYYDDLVGEKILLQGVIDCALVEADGITVIDFKTDHVTEATLEERVLTYSDQIRTYAHALERIYGLPVKAKLLYFFRMSKTVSVK